MSSLTSFFSAKRKLTGPLLVSMVESRIAPHGSTKLAGEWQPRLLLFETSFEPAVNRHEGRRISPASGQFGIRSRTSRDELQEVVAHVLRPGWFAEAAIFPGLDEVRGVFVDHTATDKYETMRLRRIAPE